MCIRDSILAVRQPLHLPQQRAYQKLPDPFISLQTFQIVHKAGGVPGISSSPEGPGKIMIALKGPPVEKQARFIVAQIFDMYQDCLLYTSRCV